MTIPDNPVSTLWQWVARAPLPVVLALLILLSSWVYALDTRVTEQEKAMAEMGATLKQVDTNVQTLLSAVLWQNKTKKENQ